MPSKYYAVKKGRKTGIFTSWEECKESVNGFANAIYKSFTDIKDAKNYLYGNKSDFKTDENKSELSAYIDGSYEDSLKKYSYAAILFHNDKKMVFSQCDDDKDLVELRNVAGELKAAMYVMNYAKKNNVKSVDLFYDYNGIEMWATGAWKANLPFTKYYSEFSNNILKSIQIKFIKIKSHSGNQYNEEVDKLAKKALYQDTTNEDIDVLYIANNEIDYSSLPTSLLDNLKKTKSGLELGTSILGNSIITSKDVYNKFKILWKNKKRLISEIDGLKSFFDIENMSFVIIVYTKKDETKLIIRGDEING